jgi:hypothetical protein
VLLSVNVLFVQLHITLNQVRTHHCCTSMQFWFRVRCVDFCRLSQLSGTCMTLFWNVIHQNISVSVAVTASGVTMHVAVLYATMMFSLSSQQWEQQQWCQWEWACCSAKKNHISTAVRAVVIYVAS